MKPAKTAKTLSNTKKQIRSERNIIDLCLQGSRWRHIDSEADIYNVIRNQHPDEHAKKDDIISTFAQSGSYRFKVRADMQNDGTYPWWLLLYSVSIDNEGNRDVLGLLVDIESEKRREEEVDKAKLTLQTGRRKEKFFKYVNQEIGFYLHNLLSRQSIVDIKRVISNIYQYTAMQNGQLEYKNETIDVETIMRSVYEDYRQYIPDGVSYLFVPGTKKLIVDGDPAMIREIMNQFLCNAVKFLKPDNDDGQKGFITVGWQYDFTLREVQMFVEDNGCGLSEKEQATCFDGLWKGDEKKRGLGIGLSLVKHHAEAMGFQVMLFSEKGVGSRFEIRKIMTKTEA